jgi:UDPglucose--hexose-1-phosphate uridylyltransferase
MTSEFRRAYFLHKFVIITPSRAKRPREIVAQTVEIKQDSSSCVLCPANIEPDLLIKTYGEHKLGWQVAVLKNKYPSVSFDNPRAYGCQEVIVDTPEHDKNFVDLSLSHIELYFKVLADRLQAISKNKKIEYILQFKNKGARAGASIKHAHSQIFATSILPPDILEEFKLAQSYKIKHSRCPYCDILARELSSERHIYEDEYVGAFAPYASEYHYEAWIFPKRHIDNISLLTAAEIKSLAKALRFILRKVVALGLDYNFFMHQVVSQTDQHFYIKVQPRDINVWAGVELGSGFVVNSVPPEEAAKYYRQ